MEGVEEPNGALRKGAEETKVTVSNSPRFKYSPTVAPSHEARVPLTETFTSSTDSKIRDGAKYEESDTRRRMSPNSGPRRLRELLKQPGIIRSLGAHDVFTALIVEQAGFETAFIGGFGTSASILGLPDLNFLTMSEMADAVRRIGCARYASWSSPTATPGTAICITSSARSRPSRPRVRAGF